MLLLYNASKAINLGPMAHGPTARPSMPSGPLGSGNPRPQGGPMKFDDCNERITDVLNASSI